MRNKRRAVNLLDGENIRDWIWDELPPYASKHMEPTFSDHSPKAARSLIFAAPNKWRGLIALCAYWIGLPNPAYRNIVGEVWGHDHSQLMGDAKECRVDVRKIIAAADFPIPAKGPVSIYRGTAGIDPKTASKGLSWTTSYETACWFACAWRINTGKANPLVLKATTNPSELIYWSNDREEVEVILRRPPLFEIDPHSRVWAGIARRVERARHAELRRKLRHRKPES